MKKKWYDAYMDVAERFSQLSTAERLKVGCVIVKDHRIISIGYNGTPHDWNNCCESETYHYRDENTNHTEMLEKGYRWDDLNERYVELVTRPEVIHAEANALMKLVRDGDSAKGAHLFVTHAPCVECAKMIVQSGISQVRYKNIYRSEEGISLLRKSKVSCEQYG